jgi:hypothetical protein
MGVMKTVILMVTFIVWKFSRAFSHKIAVESPDTTQVNAIVLWQAHSLLIIELKSQIVVFWLMTPCSLVYGYQRLRGTWPSLACGSESPPSYSLTVWQTATHFSTENWACSSEVFISPCKTTHCHNSEEHTLWPSRWRDHIILKCKYCSM